MMESWSDDYDSDQLICVQRNKSESADWIRQTRQLLKMSMGAQLPLFLSPSPSSSPSILRLSTPFTSLPLFPPLPSVTLRRPAERLSSPVDQDGARPPKDIWCSLGLKVLHQRVNRGVAKRRHISVGASHPHNFPNRRSSPEAATAPMESERISFRNPHAELAVTRTNNKKLCYRKEDSASVVLSWFIHCQHCFLRHMVRYAWFQ